MQKKYIAPEFEIVTFETEDIIAVSLADFPGDNEVTVPGSWWN